jgi:hypothetical protein
VWIFFYWRKAKIEEAAGEIAAMGGKAVAIQADASLEQQIIC